MYMKNNKLIITRIINIILIVIAIIENIYAFIKGNMLITDWISLVMTIAALVFALLYTIKGYRKEDIKIFNIFIILCIIILVLQLIGETYYVVTIGTSILKSYIITSFSLLIDCVLLIIIITVKDIEKKAALTFAGTIVAFSVFNFIRTLAEYGDMTNYISLSFSAIVLSLIICISVAAKHSSDN